ncbi:MAG: hypothetical protein ACRESA_03940, partial [Gammaproteobacteria bacterium]
MGNGKLLVCAGALVAGLMMLSAQAAPQVHVRAGVGVRGVYPSHYPVHVWAGGYWHHGWYGPRFGWWWVVGPAWYYYPTPVY